MRISTGRTVRGVFRRKRFRDVIERQLAFFEEEDGDLLDDVDRALDKYNRADRDEAEELYGDYQLAIEAATDRLAEFRDAYARTLDEDDAEQYVQEFNRGVVDRWRALALTIEESYAPAIATAACASARWLRPCGKLPRNSFVAGSISSA